MFYTGTELRESKLEMGTASLFSQWKMPQCVWKPSLSVIFQFCHVWNLSLLSLKFILPLLLLFTPNVHTTVIFPILPDSFLTSLLQNWQRSRCGWTETTTALKSITAKFQSYCFPLLAREASILRAVMHAPILVDVFLKIMKKRLKDEGQLVMESDTTYVTTQETIKVLATARVDATWGEPLKALCLPCWCAVVVAGIAVCVSPRTAGAAAGSLTAGGLGRSGEGEQTACAPVGDAAGVCVLKGRPVLHQPETVRGGAVLKDTSLKIIWRKKQQRRKKGRRKEGRKRLLSNTDGDNNI